METLYKMLERKVGGRMTVVSFPCGNCGNKIKVEGDPENIKGKVWKCDECGENTLLKPDAEVRE
jgi:predicted RNA-binding Zn-ribbon protein involved in translation (DUF1610 family)